MQGKELKKVRYMKMYELHDIDVDLAREHAKEFTKSISIESIKALCDRSASDSCFSAWINIEEKRLEFSEKIDIRAVRSTADTLGLDCFIGYVLPSQVKNRIKHAAEVAFIFGEIGG